MTDKDKLMAALILAEKLQIIPVGFNESERGREGEREREGERGGGRVSERENISTRLNEVIYGKGEFNLDDLQDIVGDGDLAEYL